MWCRVVSSRAPWSFLGQWHFLKSHQSSQIAISTRYLIVTQSHLKGHSHWQNIRHTKEKFDAQRSKAINFLLKRMKVAVKQGFDSKLNRDLAAVEGEFLKQGLGMDTYNRVLQNLKLQPDVPVHLAVIGPSGTFFVVHMEASTKSLAENALKKYIVKTGGGFRLAPDLNAVRAWFNEKGVLIIDAKDRNNAVVTLEQIEESCIELDCEEVTSFMEDDQPKYEILCNPRKVDQVGSALSERGFVVETNELEFRPIHPVNVEANAKERIERLYKLLEDEDMVVNIYDNIDPATENTS